MDTGRRKLASLCDMIPLSRHKRFLVGQHDLYYLAGLRRSYGLILDRATDSLTVFVHGFWGDSTSTWQEFQRFVDDAQLSFPNFHDSDLLFFDYPSTKWTIEVAAHDLLRFLKSVYPRTNEERFASLQPAASIFGLNSRLLLSRPVPFEYTKLTLIGHSMGAVILRRALLIELTNQIEELRAGASAPDDSLLHANLILFAPAHLGFKYGDLADIVSSSHWALAALRLIYQIRHAPAYADLVALSPVLRGIQDQTERYVTEFPFARALRATIVWGARENVVFMGGYAEDSVVAPIPARDHIDICKPSDQYESPMEVIDGSSRKTTNASTTSIVRSESLSPRTAKTD